MEKINRYWKTKRSPGKRAVKRLLATWLSIIVFVLTGCSDSQQKEPDIQQTTSIPESETGTVIKPGTEELSAIYHQIYTEVLNTGITDRLEIMKEVLKRLGEAGYVAVDEGNQVNMEGAWQVIKFCESVESKEKASLKILVAAYSGGFTAYDLTAEEGQVHITREYYQYDDSNCPEIQDIAKYQADLWQYTDEGYLLFEGDYLSDACYALTLSSTSEQAALRVEPLDEKCREWNRRYLLPVGYGQNNMFLTDWDEQDFGDLDFYDVFDSFYPVMYGHSVFYEFNGNWGEEPISRIPQEVFEDVVLAHFHAIPQVLQAKTDYLPEVMAYEYRPRGFYEAEYPDIPYPEVTGYGENEDGTITLTVNAVYPYGNTSKAFSHETVIRPLEEGGFQYVSNRILDSEEPDLWWHSHRLSKEEWEKAYGKEEGYR